LAFQSRTLARIEQSGDRGSAAGRSEFRWTFNGGGRRALYGRNELPAAGGRSTWVRLAQQINNPPICVLLAATLITLLLGPPAAAAFATGAAFAQSSATIIAKQLAEQENRRRATGATRWRYRCSRTARPCRSWS
jgi:magnesium-transporting ATPase (P-type)